MFDHLRKYAAVYVVAISGLLLTCLSSWNVRQELQSNHLKEFQWAAADRIQSVRAVVEQGLDTLLEIRGLFYAARSIDDDEFLVFTESILKRRSYIERLMWVPLSAAPALLESPTASDGRTPVVPSGSNAPRTMSARSDHQPATPAAFSAARTGSGTAQRAAPAADSELAEVIARAAQTGKLAVSGRTRLDPARPGAGYAIYAALPVFGPADASAGSSATAEKGASLLGFVVGAYDLQELVHVAINLLEPRGVEVLVRDDSAVGDARLLHFYASRLESRTARSDSGLLPEGGDEQSQVAVRIPVGDRHWSITCVATDTFRSAEAFTEAHWLVLFGGLACTVLLCLYLVRSRRELENRIRLTQTIYEREELFRQLAETVDVVFWATNAEATRLEYIGPAFRHLTGQGVRLESSELSLMLDVFRPADGRALHAALEQLRSNGGRFTIVLPVERGDRGLRWLRVCGFPVREPGCELSRIVGFFEDITEHKLAEDALRDSEEKLRTLFNHSPDLIFTVDSQADILLTNRPLPFPIGTGGEKRSELVLPANVRIGYRDRLQQVFASGCVDHFQFARDDATWWEVRMVPISSASEVMAAMVVLTDVTENRKLQWQAIRNARLASLGVLSAGVAHEINNPNHAILANASLLARIWRDALPILAEYEEEQGDFLLAGLSFHQASQVIERGMTEIGDNAKRIRKIVNNLKHLGKEDRGQMDEVADVGKILRAVARLLAARIRKHTDAFSLALPDSLPAVKGNVQQLEQVFINVIVNALESLPERSRSVRVSAAADDEGKRITVQVEDQGQGIAEEVITQIGEPFFTTKGDSGGTGLGLSISSSIIEKHGGVLRFESRENEGTTVCIELPVIKED